jgi:hypothetical protein
MEFNENIKYSKPNKKPHALRDTAEIVQGKAADRLRAALRRAM